MNILIKNNYLYYKGYKLKCALGKLGLSNLKKEGDLTTPRGIYKLGLLYYRKDRLKNLRCKIRKKSIKKDSGWCDDIKSDKYNKEINFPYKYRAEKLFRQDTIYDIFIDIKYNSAPVIKGKGSGIFLHLCKNNYKKTRGCVAIIKKDFMKIVPLINKNTKINIK